MLFRKIMVSFAALICLGTLSGTAAFAETTVPFVDEDISLAYEIAEHNNSTLTILNGTAYCDSSTRGKDVISILVTQTLQKHTGLWKWETVYGAEWSGTTTYKENQNSTAASGNNSFERAEYVPISSLLNKTYPYLLGNFQSNESFTDTVDYYSFSITKNTGNKGRVAISLENIPSGHNYNLYLYNSSHTLVASSTKSENSNEVVKTPEITSSGTYYIKVEAVTVPDPSASSYRIKADEYITTKTVTASLTPRTLTTTKDTSSADASIDESKLPADAKIVSAKVSATKPSTTAAYNHMLRVKIGKNGSYVPVTWKSGDIDVPELVGQNCCGTWYAGFKASMLSGVSALDSISMSSFKLIIEYEYDSLK